MLQDRMPDLQEPGNLARQFDLLTFRRVLGYNEVVHDHEVAING